MVTRQHTSKILHHSTHLAFLKKYIFFFLSPFLVTVLIYQYASVTGYHGSKICQSEVMPVASTALVDTWQQKQWSQVDWFGVGHNGGLIVCCMTCSLWRRELPPIRRQEVFLTFLVEVEAPQSHSSNFLASFTMAGFGRAEQPIKS